MIFNIEYEIPPLRAIYHHGVDAPDEETAIKRFQANNPRAKIRKIELYKIRNEVNVRKKCKKCGEEMVETGDIIVLPDGYELPEYECKKCDK